MTMTTDEAKKGLELCAKARAEVQKLSNGMPWVMCIPAQSTDSDVVMGNLVLVAEGAFKEVVELHAELDRLRPIVDGARALRWTLDSEGIAEYVGDLGNVQVFFNAVMAYEEQETGVPADGTQTAESEGGTID